MSSDSPTDRELLLQILWRLGRIEQQLEKGTSQVPERERRSSKDMLSELMARLARIERITNELSERIRRIERDADHSRGSPTVDRQILPRMNRRPSTKESLTEDPIKPASPEGSATPEPGSGSGTPRVVRRKWTAEENALLARVSRPAAFLLPGGIEPPKKSSKPEDTSAERDQRMSVHDPIESEPVRQEEYMDDEPADAEASFEPLTREEEYDDDLPPDDDHGEEVRPSN
jgi:hypothetical protein